MSDLLQTIKDDFLAARKARESSTAAFLSALIGTIESAAITAEGRVELTEQHVVTVLKSYLKKNAELLAIENLPENAIKMVEFEKGIIEKYLPTQLTEEKIREIFTELDESNLGLMMKHLKDNFAGLYDGTLASKIAKEFL
jgi:uncharacterized protein YqeY